MQDNRNGKRGINGGLSPAVPFILLLLGGWYKLTLMGATYNTDEVSIWRWGNVSRYITAVVGCCGGLRPYRKAREECRDRIKKVWVCCNQVYS